MDKDFISLVSVLASCFSYIFFGVFVGFFSCDLDD